MSLIEMIPRIYFFNNIVSKTTPDSSWKTVNFDICVGHAKCGGRSHLPVCNLNEPRL